jgi:hypothetical protein
MKKKSCKLAWQFAVSKSSPLLELVEHFESHGQVQF